MTQPSASLARPSLASAVVRLPSLAALTLFFVAVGLRFFRLSYHPLWMDELYGHQLGALGLNAIIRNSLEDPHPPLFYIIQWVGSGFNLFRSEWGLRWVAAACGALTVLVLYALMRRVVGQGAAFMSSLLLAVLPTHFFFSQEARSTTWDVLLATLALALFYRIERGARHRSLWIGYTAILLVGLYSTYGFAFIVGVQLLYLAVGLREWRRSVAIGFTVLLLYWPAAAMGVQALRHVAGRHQSSEAIALQATLVDLLGGGFRPFVEDRWTLVLTAGLCGLALLSLPFLARHRERRFLWYCVLQVALPLVGFFGLLMGVLGIRMPPYEYKQFMLLLPAMWVLIGVTLQVVGGSRRAGGAARVLLGGLTVALLVICVVKLGPYWQTPKDTLAYAVQAIAPQLREDDAVVSLHYGYNGAIGFYLPGVEPYGRNYITDPAEERFHRVPFLVPIALVGEIELYSADDILAHPRVWMLSTPNYGQLFQDAFTARCSVTRDEWHGPWQLRLLENCGPSLR